MLNSGILDGYLAIGYNYAGFGVLPTGQETCTSMPVWTYEEVSSNGLIGKSLIINVGKDECSTPAQESCTPADSTAPTTKPDSTGPTIGPDQTTPSVRK